MDLELPEVEIQNIAPLAADQEALLDSHSVLNVLNVLAGELAMLGLCLEDNPDMFPASLRHCQDYAEGLRSAEKARECAESTDRYADRIEEELAAMCNRHSKRLSEPKVIESLRSLHGIIGILRLRAKELRVRSQNPDRWEAYPPASLRSSFSQVFSAMEGFSHGRFRIVNSPFVKGPRDYFIELDFDARPERQIWMPSVFVDVMRDLIANARKYTPPGGWIVASLHQDPHELKFSVQDSGRGIPEAEIPRVVEFGQRASNTEDVRSLGGGFGLTKAFTVTRRFGGRFWIASKEGVGTRVRICLPRPDFARN